MVLANVGLDVEGDRFTAAKPAQRAGGAVTRGEAVGEWA